MNVEGAFNDLFVKGLSATVGLRLDYEKTSMKYRSISEPIDFDFSISMQRPPLNLLDQHMKAPSTFILKSELRQ